MVKKYSDRGSIKNLNKVSPIDIGDDNIEPSPSEIRMKKLFEISQFNKDKNLQSALGFITTDYISDKNALPLSIYRIKTIVNEIKEKSSEKIDELSRQLSDCFSDTSYINPRLIKKASIYGKPVFRRVIK